MVCRTTQVGNVGWIHQSLLSTPIAVIPTTTPLPPTPTPEFLVLNQTQRIGPIRNFDREEGYSVEVTLQQMKWSDGIDYHIPKTNHIYAIAYVRVVNLGPEPMRSVGTGDFEVMDANGALHRDDFLNPLVTDCRLELVDLIAGGSVEGCIAYEVPMEGPVNLIFAPYQYDGMGAGRYLAFALRP